MNKKIIELCKGIIGITLTLAMMLYLGFANGVLTQAYADETQQEGNVQSTEQTIQQSPEQSTQSATEISTENATESTTEQSTENPEQGSTNNTVIVDDKVDGESDATTLPTQGEPMNGVDTMNNTTIVIASITYTYTKDASETKTDITKTDTTKTDTETSLEPTDVTTETLEFYNLQEAFAGAAQVQATMKSYGEENYIPTIQLMEDIAQNITVANTENASFILDLNGHIVTLNQDSYFDFGEGTVTITDAAYMAAIESTTAEGTVETAEGTAEEIPLGKISGSGAYLFTGKGGLTFVTGYYQNENAQQIGTIIDAAGTLVFDDGYFLTGSGQIVNNMTKDASIITVNGGFYTYDVVKGFSNRGTIVLAEEKQLVQSVATIAEAEVTGYAVARPEYLVTITVNIVAEDGTVSNKDLTLYFSGFPTAWDRAIELSRGNGAAEATIDTYDQTITAINISQGYTMTAGEDGSTAHIRFSNITFQRKDGFDGNFFNVSAGTLSFEQCILDGYIDEFSVSQGSLIWANGQGIVTLKDTTVQNNRSVINGQTGDPGAGIALAAGTSLQVAGSVEVSNNSRYTPATLTEAASTLAQNVYMEAGAELVITGSVTGNIGVNYQNGVIAGLTALGRFDQEYLNGQEGVVDESSMKIFTIDNYPTYFLGYHAETNQLYWDKTVRYLPEAGAVRVELIVLAIGLLAFVLRYLPVIKKRKELDTVILILAATCLVGGSVVGFLSIQNEHRMSENNMQVIETMTARQNQASAPVTDAKILATEEAVTEEASETASGLAVPDDGREYYGIVEIPELDIRLPILMEYSDANMKTTACVYYGDTANDNLVIVGHNYDSQFGQLNHVEEGLEVWIYLMDGESYRYVSTSVEAYNPDQVEEVLMGDWDLTLLTCNYAGDKRITLRCEVAEQE